MLTKILKLLFILALIGSIAWFIAAPDYEPAIAIITSLSAFIASYIASKKSKSNTKDETNAGQDQDVSGGGVGLQAGGDITTGAININNSPKTISKTYKKKVIDHSVTVQEAREVNIINNPAQRSPSGKLLQLPPRPPNFVGREVEIEQLLADIHPGRVVTICGPGGMGKSALVSQAVWRLTEDVEPPPRFPDGIIYHDFYFQPKSEIVLEAIAEVFGLEPRPTPHEAAKQALGGRTALLLLDGAENADDLRAVLDVRGNCGVIVTSRKREDAVEGRQDLKPLDASDAVELLHAWGKEKASDDSTTERICELVGRLPLAVRLVGRHLDESGETAADYLAWLEQSLLEALDQGKRREESVSVLLNRSLKQVSDLACELLGLAGLLAFTPFSRNVL